MTDGINGGQASPTPDGAGPLGSSRRRFLAHAAAAAGAAALLGGATHAKQAGRPALARTGPIGARKARTPIRGGEPLRIGVIGTGGMGTGHCYALAEFMKQGREAVEIVALCDVNDLRAKAAADGLSSRYGWAIDGIYRNHEDLLAREDIHGVVVATTEHWHAPIAEDAILAGKDVYVEKPLTLRLDEALRLRQVVLKHPDAVFQVGTQMIMLPKYIAARKMIADGKIGKATFSQTSYCRNNRDGEWLYYGIDPAWKPGVNIDWDRWCGALGKEPWDPARYARWRRYPRYSTGIVGDLLVHQVTPMIMALDQGWPTRVQAIGGHYVDTAMENHDQVNLTVQFEKGHTMIVAGATSNEVGLENMIRGHKGNIYLNSRHCIMRPERQYVDEIDAETIECPDIGNDQDALRLNWLQAMRSREAAISNVDLATKVMVMVDLATRSMWEGGDFTFDPSTMTVARG